MLLCIEIMLNKREYCKMYNYIVYLSIEKIIKRLFKLIKVTNDIIERLDWSSCWNIFKG